MKRTKKIIGSKRTQRLFKGIFLREFPGYFPFFDKKEKNPESWRCCSAFQQQKREWKQNHNKPIALLCNKRKAITKLNYDL